MNPKFHFGHSRVIRLEFHDDRIFVAASGRRLAGWNLDGQHIPASGALKLRVNSQLDLHAFEIGFDIQKLKGMLLKK